MMRETICVTVQCSVLTKLTKRATAIHLYLPIHSFLLLFIHNITLICRRLHQRQQQHSLSIWFDRAAIAWNEIVHFLRCVRGALALIGQYANNKWINRVVSRGSCFVLLIYTLWFDSDLRGRRKYNRFFGRLQRIHRMPTAHSNVHTILTDVFLTFS